MLHERSMDIAFFVEHFVYIIFKMYSVLFINSLFFIIYRFTSSESVEFNFS